MTANERTSVPAGTVTATANTQLADSDVVDVLNDLLENCRDGEYGFRTCAEELSDDNAELRQLFMDRAEGCRRAGEELMRLIVQRGGTPDKGGTAAGAMHRGWVHVKGSLGADSELSMLEECERGEDAAVARYRKALKQPLPDDVRTVIQAQAEGAQRNHDKIRDRRDAAKRAAGS